MLYHYLTSRKHHSSKDVSKKRKLSTHTNLKTPKSLKWNHSQKKHCKIQKNTHTKKKTPLKPNKKTHPKNLPNLPKRPTPGWACRGVSLNRSPGRPEGKGGRFHGCQATSGKFVTKKQRNTWLWVKKMRKPLGTTGSWVYFFFPTVVFFRYSTLFDSQPYGNVLNTRLQ